MSEEKRIISTENGNLLANKFDIPYFETSALKGIGINQAIEKLAERII